jgi:hypothetical protein
MQPTDAARCACGHLVTSHHLTPGKKRTYCRVTTMIDGTCQCRLFEEAPRVRR